MAYLKLGQAVLFRVGDSSSIFSDDSSFDWNDTARLFLEKERLEAKGSGLGMLSPATSLTVESLSPSGDAVVNSATDDSSLIGPRLSNSPLDIVALSGFQIEVVRCPVLLGLVGGACFGFSRSRRRLIIPIDNYNLSLQGLLTIIIPLLQGRKDLGTHILRLDGGCSGGGSVVLFDTWCRHIWCNWEWRSRRWWRRNRSAGTRL